MQKLSEWISECDLFAVPVQLSFKGNTKFRSVIGGTCSILLILALGILFPINFFSAQSQPTFTTSSQQDIQSLLNNLDKSYDLYTNETTVMVSLQGSSYPFEADYRVMFKNGEDYIPAVYCRDFYKEQIESGADDGFWQTVADFYSQICPDTSKIEIELSTLGGWHPTFQFEVYSCEYAKQKEIELGIPTYSNVTCNDASVGLDKSLDVVTQFVTTNFNADQYYQNETLQYYEQILAPYAEVPAGQFGSKSYQVFQTNTNFFSDFLFTSTFTSLTSYTFDEVETDSTSPSGGIRYMAQFFPSQIQTNHTVTRSIYFTDFLSNIGGLVITLMGVMSFFISSYQKFIQNKSTIEVLYSEEEHKDSSATQLLLAQSNPQSEDEKAKAVFKSKIEQSRDFKVGYFSFIFLYVLFEYLCCLKRCFYSCECCKRRMDRHDKFLLAKDRLLAEKDILNIVGMNRITRLLHKTHFKSRQRQSVKYFHHYVLRDEDVGKPEPPKQVDTIAEIVDKLVSDDFQPTTSEDDARIFYEITGQVLPGFEEMLKDADSTDESPDVSSDGDSSSSDPVGQAVNFSQRSMQPP